MTVVTMTRKNSGMQIKGEIHKHEHIASIVQTKENVVELIIGKNWQVIVNLDLYQIIAVEA